MELSLSCVFIPYIVPSMPEILSLISILWVNLASIVPRCNPKDSLLGFPQFVLSLLRLFPFSVSVTYFWFSISWLSWHYVRDLLICFNFLFAPSLISLRDLFIYPLRTSIIFMKLILSWFFLCFSCVDYLGLVVVG